MIAKTENKQLILEAKFFKSLASKSRLSILDVLMDGAKTVGAIVETTGLSQSNASMHLTCLLDCGLVRKNRNGQQMHYCLSTDEIKDLIVVMRKIASNNAEGILSCNNLLEIS